MGLVCRRPELRQQSPWRQGQHQDTQGGHRPPLPDGFPPWYGRQEANSEPRPDATQGRHHDALGRHQPPLPDRQPPWHGGQDVSPGAHHPRAFNAGHAEPSGAQTYMQQGGYEQQPYDPNKHMDGHTPPNGHWDLGSQASAYIHATRWVRATALRTMGCKQEHGRASSTKWALGSKQAATLGYGQAPAKWI